MITPNNYNNILNVLSNSSNSSTIKSPIIPATTMQEFNYNVLTYYNQYYASAQTTQTRRILRNYYNNQQSIKEFNRNPFMMNKSKKFNFLYTNQQTYMIIENQNSFDIYTLINNCWCHMKHFSNKYDCIEFQNIIKKYALKNYSAA